VLKQSRFAVLNEFVQGLFGVFLKDGLFADVVADWRYTSLKAFRYLKAYSLPQIDSIPRFFNWALLEPSGDPKIRRVAQLGFMKAQSYL